MDKNLSFPMQRAAYEREVPKTILRIALNKCLNICARFTILPGIRNALYRLMGIRLGKKVFIGLDSYLDDQFPELVTIEENTTVAFRVVIVAHDDAGERTVDPVNIGKGVYIGVGAIILPGVRIGDNAVVGAGAVVTRDVPPSAVVAGVPAKILREKE